MELNEKIINLYNAQSSYFELIDKLLVPSLMTTRQSLLAKLAAENMTTFHDSLLNAPAIAYNTVDCSGDAISIHSKNLKKEESEQLAKCLEAFVPWKKGPFDIFGHYIDAEWKSDWKWNRISPHIKTAPDSIIADIGCNNGYYMYKLKQFNPRLVIGFEPFAKHWYTFQLLQHYFKCPDLVLELFGVEYIDLFPGIFDTILCLGILYHHTDPVGILKKMHHSLKPGGQIIIDCQGIPGEQSVCLVPEKRYANARAIWFLPTKPCLVNWVKRANFRQIEVFFDEELSIEEQRPTKWAPIKSLEDFIDPKDPTKTIEGYPRPRRFYLKAYK